MGRREMRIGFWWESKKERERLLGKPKCRWEDNIKMELREIGMGWYGLDSSGSG
jgi:hypothetical protein